MYERNNNPLSIIAAFAIGGLIGAGVALLMAPQAGQETRSQIRDKGNEIKGMAIETAEDTRSRAQQKIEDLKQGAVEKVSTLTNRGQELTEDKKQLIDEQVDAAKKAMSY